MIFSEPCCEALRRCLEDGGDRTFRRLDGLSGPLLLRIATVVRDTPSGRERQILERGVNFCPFCGKPLQTVDAVKRYLNARG